MISEHDYQIHVHYGNAEFDLQAKIEYHTNQIMRIRVYGKTNSLLLENNYPLLQLVNSKKAIQWKLREGSFTSDDRRKDAALLLNIISQLEREIKGGQGSYSGYLASKD